MSDERYRFVRELGAGGMGAVRLVHDRERQEQVAQKRIRAVSPSSLLRFKREFRVVERLLHPNLVRLYELGEDRDGVYFTMQAIDGADLGEFCAVGIGDSSGGSGEDRPESEESADTLDADAATVEAAQAEALGARAAPSPEAGARDPFERVLRRVLYVMPQVVEALSFLHAHGIVHRDLKPANVLIDREGVVKLLDFGVLASLRDPVQTDAGSMVGTIGFMAPEQLRGAEAGTASDLYALGAMLFTLLTGREVFGGATPMQKVVAHLRDRPPALDSLAPEAPSALVEACERLLAKEPERRPSLEELSRLLVAAGARAPVLARPERERADLFGRGGECRRLRELVLSGGRQRPALVVLRGPSGAGKSALAAWIAQEAVRADALVLHGRGRANDQLAFNALDGAVDQLAMALGRHRRLGDEVRVAASRAATAFPVLAAIEEPLSAARRDEAFDALVDLLDHETRGGGLIFIDDLQWADSDSLALLKHVVRRASPALSVVATLRDDEPGAAAHRLLDDVEDAVVIDVGPLDDESLAHVVRRAAADAGCDPSPEQVSRAVATAAGRPFVAEVAGRALATGGADADDPLQSTVADAVSRNVGVLAALLAGGGWTPLGLLARVSGARVGQLDDTVRELALAGVVRRAGPVGAGGSVDVYHDAVRASLARLMAPEPLRDAHAAFASAISDGALPAPPQRLVRHLLGAGRTDDVVEPALAAAKHAEGQLAFGLAADMYGVALEHGAGDDAEIWQRRGDALERSARYGEAASCWLHLAGMRSGVDAAHATMNAANALLGANRVADGVATLNDALAAVGDPPVGSTGPGAWVAALRFLAGPRRLRARPSARDDAALARAACDVKIGLMVGYFDPLAGVKVLRRARDAYARMGAWSELAWCDHLFAAFAENGSRSSRTPPLVRKYRAAAEAVSAEHDVDSPRLRAIRHFLDGSAHMRSTRWAEADAEFARCIDVLDESGLRGVFEQTYALSQRGVIAFFVHDLRGLDRVLRSYDEIVGDTDSAILSHRRLFETVAHALRGDIDRARAAADAVRAALPPEIPTIQRSLANIVLRVPELVAPGEAQPLRPLDATEVELAGRFRLFHLNVGGAYSGLSALIEACALRAGHPDASARRVGRYARVSLRSAPVAAGMAERAMAYAQDARGRPERALELLELAERRADEHRRPTAAHIARFQRGLRLRGDEGRRLRDEATAHARLTGITEAILAEDPAMR